MDKKRKAQIDNIWRDTLFGEWIFAVLNGNKTKAMHVGAKIAEAFPFTLYNAERILGEKIAEELRPGEFQEYLEALEVENPALVDLMISQDIFGNANK